MSDFVGIDVQGIEDVKKLMKNLPPAVQDQVVDDVSEYMLKVMRLNPPEKRVKRKTAYGVTFFTERQRRFFFAALRDGRINVPYNRTQGQSRGWKIIGKGKDALVVNETPGVLFTRDNDRQARLNKLVGWKTVAEEISTRAERIMEIANAAVKQALRKLRK
jgi:hypothetical protein